MLKAIQLPLLEVYSKPNLSFLLLKLSMFFKKVLGHVL
jgi:hypothetical protein